jgi:hypothetical protein
VSTSPRIYISAPDDVNLAPDHVQLKEAILEAVKSQGFELQIFHKAGIPAHQGWNFSNADSLMSRCHGAVILALPKWHEARLLNGTSASLPSEYNHFEGGLAVAHDVSLLIVAHPAERISGITDTAGGKHIYFWPSGQGGDWANSEHFRTYLSDWAEIVRARRKIFLGYCSSAKTTADALMHFLQRTFNTTVVNYMTDFRPGQTILEEIEAADKQCTVGIFLFTKDDQLAGIEAYAAPRDNVIFEAGYFTRSKGKDHVLIIREEGAKMPADWGGVIYVPLKDRTDISPIESRIRTFLDAQL